MIFYLRNENNENIVDVEVWVKTPESGGEYVELSSTILIKPYSKLLLDNLNKKNKIMDDFESLSELRGWLWERYFMVNKNTNFHGSQIDDVVKKLKVILTKIAKDYKLTLVED
jgi:hypothetical protein